MSTAYGVRAVTAGVDTVVNVANLNISCAIIANESPYTLLCKIDGTGSSKWIQAQSIDRVDIPTTGFTGNLVFTPQVVLSNTSNAPSYALVIDTFGVGEPITGVYPIALSRTTNVGNSVNTNMGGSTTLQNDNNPANTQIIESTVTGSPQSNVLFDNSGNVTIAEYVAAVRTVLFSIIAGGATAVKIGAVARTVEILGPLLVDGTLSVTGITTLTGDTTLNNKLIVKGTSSLDNATITTDGAGVMTLKKIKLAGNTTQSISPDPTTANALNFDGPDGTRMFQLTPNSIFASTGRLQLGISANGDIMDTVTGTTYIKAASSIVFQSPNGTTRATVDSSGLNIASGNLQFTTGSIARSSTFTGAASGNYNHNNGNTPAVCFVETDTASSSQTDGVANYGTTQVSVTTGAGIHFRAWAVGF